MIWLFRKRDWKPEIRWAIDYLLTVETTAEIHVRLVELGVPEEDATKLLLFVPSAFAREMFEPEGVSFSDDYLRSDDGGVTQHLYSYLREPIYQQARVLARQLIEEERFSEVRIVIAWSAEGNLVQRAIDNGHILQAAQIRSTHNF